MSTRPACWRTISDALQARLSCSGIDIVAPLNASWYNDELRRGPPADREASERLVLPDSDGALLVLVGNSRAIWDPFVADCAARLAIARGDNNGGGGGGGGGGGSSSSSSSTSSSSASSLLGPDPLERFVRAAVLGAVAELPSTSEAATAAPPAAATAAAAPAAAAPGGPAPPLLSRAYWSSDVGGDGMIAAQRMASAARLAHFDRRSYLCAHPVHGPWFALRGALLFRGVVGPGAGAGAQPPPELPSPLSAAGERRVGRAMDRALELAGSYEGSYGAGSDGWEHWLDVREAVQPEHPARYSAAQVRYHYTKDAEILVAEAEAQCA